MPTVFVDYLTAENSQKKNSKEPATRKQNSAPPVVIDKIIRKIHKINTKTACLWRFYYDKII